VPSRRAEAPLLHAITSEAVRAARVASNPSELWSSPNIILTMRPLSWSVDGSDTRDSLRDLVSRQRASWIVGAITVVGLLLRLPSFNSSLFGDEISTYFIVTGHSLGRVLQLVHSNQETTPPLYFILAWVTKGLGSSVQSIRLPSLVAGTAAIPLTYLLGLRTVGRRAALIGAALVALSPFMIYMSTDARAYMVMCFFALASTLALLQALDSGRLSWWIVYAASSCAAAYTHYTVVFLLTAQFVWAFWTRPDARRWLLLANVAALLAYVPWFGGFLQDLHGPNEIGGLEPFGFHTILRDLENWSIGSDLSLRKEPSHLTIILIGVAIAVIGIALTVRRRAKWVPSARIVLVVVLALATPVGTILSGIVGHSVFNSQDLIASWPGLALAVGVLLTRPPGALRVAAVALVLAGFAIGGARMVTSGVQNPNVDAAAAFIGRVGSCGDPIVAESIFAHPLTEIDVAVADVGPTAQRCHPILRLGAPPLSEELKSLAGPHGQPLPFSTPSERPQVVAQQAAKLARNGTLFLVLPTNAPIKDFAYFPASAVTQFLGALHGRFHLVRQVTYSGLIPESVYILRR
jgi:Dolichyl-phosphate-mannose-protein mannosyltransferase